MQGRWVGQPELVKKLHDYWHAGMRSNEIAMALGGGLTAKAVRAKARHDDLPKRHTRPTARKTGVFLLPATPSQRKERMAPSMPPPSLGAPEPLTDAAGLPITVVNVRDGHCRYVHGDPAGEYRFCGHARKFGSFCDFHGPRCYTAVNYFHPQARI